MTQKPLLYLVPREMRKRTTPSIAEINRPDAYDGDIVAFVACLSLDARDDATPFDSLGLAVRLRKQLHTIAGRVPDAAFMELASICGELLNDGAQAILADHKAAIAVTKARHAKK